MSENLFTPQQWASLHEALLSAFPSASDLERMVRFGLGENLHTIAGDRNLQATVFDLLTWAQAQGRLSELIIEAGKANSSNPELRAWMQENLAPDATFPPAVNDDRGSVTRDEPLTPAKLREPITQGLTRSEVGVLWLELLGGSMDEEMPGRSQPDCVIELLARASRRNRLSELVATIAHLYPHVSLAAPFSR